MCCKCYFSDVLLFNFLFVDLLDGVSEVVIEVNPEGTDKDDVGAHWVGAAVRQTVFVEKHHLSYIEVFGIVESVAIEALDEYFVTVVPQREGVVGSDDCHPFLLGMESRQFYFVVGSVVAYAQVEQDFVFASHLPVIIIKNT